LGGTFLSQQIGYRNEIELNEAAEAGPPELTPTADQYREQLASAGLVDIEVTEDFIERRYLDVGAVAYFMKAIPWQVGGFDVTAEPERLRPIHDVIERDGAFVTQMHRFLLSAHKRAGTART
ncbi:MAG: hypothetical protein WD826_08520, partial [Actinomycetota bacterium]